MISFTEQFNDTATPPFINCKQQQAQAQGWCAVFDAIHAVDPEFVLNGTTEMDSAVAWIKAIWDCYEFSRSDKIADADELEEHRAAYATVCDEGFDGPEELLAAYTALVKSRCRDAAMLQHNAGRVRYLEEVVADLRLRIAAQDAAINSYSGV